jgi:hypothetical protein
MTERPTVMGRCAVEKFLRAHPENITNREVRILVVGLGFKRGQSNLQISFADPLVKDIPIPFVRESMRKESGTKLH